jgi:hypothetical protein
MKPTPQETERRVHMMEEAAEVIQELSKSLRFGLHKKRKGVPVQVRLENELGNFLATLEVLIEAKEVDKDLINMECRNKLKQLSKNYLYSQNQVFATRALSR